MSKVRMKKVYKLRYGEGFEWLLPVNQADFDLLRFDGQPRSGSWKPVEMRRLKVSEQGNPLQPCDFPACSGGDMLIMSRAAREKIGSCLEQYGELLPLSCDEGEFWALNVTKLLSVLDESSSQLLRASDTGAILMIRKYSFRHADLGQADLFKLSQTIRGLIYVTDNFVELIKWSGLTGLEFVLVWAPN